MLFVLSFSALNAVPTLGPARGVRGAPASVGATAGPGAHASRVPDGQDHGALAHRREQSHHPGNEF